MFIPNTPAVMLRVTVKSWFKAKTEPQIIDKSIATAELLAHIIISKFADHQPLYRQSLIYGRSGVHLSDSTMADWVDAVVSPLSHW